MRFLLTCLVAGAAALGCGRTGHEQPVTLEEHPIAFAQALCGTLFRCCSSSVMEPSAAGWVGAPPSQASCEESVAAASASQLEYIKSSIAAARAAYDPEATGACIERLRNVDCGEFRWPTASFLRARGCWSLAGQVAAGRPCFRSFECSHDGVCPGGASATCVPGKQVDENCDYYYSSPMGDTSDCRRDLVCANVCTAAGHQPLGAACTAATECASRICRVDFTTKRRVCSPVLECALKPTL